MNVKEIRESIKEYGRSAQTNEAILTLIVGSKAASALLKHTNLYTLCSMSISDLKRIPGIGEAKASLLYAAFELSRRANNGYALPKAVKESKDAYDAIKAQLLHLDHEQFWVIFLNRANHVIGKLQIGKGGYSAVTVEARIIFKEALAIKANAVILAHNHPSGNIKPSQADQEVTKRIKKISEFMDIPLLDHIIIGGNEYTSFMDEGYL